MRSNTFVVGGERAAKVRGLEVPATLLTRANATLAPPMFALTAIANGEESVLMQTPI
jgi:hypothetical protein